AERLQLVTSLPHSCGRGRRTGSRRQALGGSSQCRTLVRILPPCLADKRSVRAVSLPLGDLLWNAGNSPSLQSPRYRHVRSRRLPGRLWDVRPRWFSTAPTTVTRSSSSCRPWFPTRALILTSIQPSSTRLSRPPSRCAASRETLGQD